MGKTLLWVCDRCDFKEGVKHTQYHQPPGGWSNVVPYDKNQNAGRDLHFCPSCTMEITAKVDKGNW